MSTARANICVRLSSALPWQRETLKPGRIHLRMHYLELAKYWTILILWWFARLKQAPLAMEQWHIRFINSPNAVVMADGSAFHLKWAIKGGDTEMTVNCARMSGGFRPAIEDVPNIKKRRERGKVISLSQSQTITDWDVQNYHGNLEPLDLYNRKRLEWNQASANPFCFVVP